MIDAGCRDDRHLRRAREIGAVLGLRPQRGEGILERLLLAGGSPNEILRDLGRTLAGGRDVRPLPGDAAPTGLREGEGGMRGPAVPFGEWSMSVGMVFRADGPVRAAVSWALLDMYRAGWTVTDAIRFLVKAGCGTLRG